MKRNITAPGNRAVPAPAPSRAAERQFQEMMRGMVNTMAKRFENQTFKQLNKGTIDKFEDAQVGNYAGIFLKLSKKARRSIMKQFSDKKIQRAIRMQLKKVNDRNQNNLYSKVEEITGISAKDLITNEGLAPTINALQLETEQWALRLRDNALNSFVSNSLRGMAEGKDVTEIIKDFELLKDKTGANADMVARTQIGTFNSLLTKKRAQNLGIQKARWRTSEDERVRKCHQVRNGKEFDLEEGLHSSCDGKTLLPGIDYNCRCDYELIIPEM